MTPKVETTFVGVNFVLDWKNIDCMRPGGSGEASRKTSDLSLWNDQEASREGELRILASKESPP